MAGGNPGRTFSASSVPWKTLEGVQFRYNNRSHQVDILLGRDRLDALKQIDTKGNFG